jgi:hypothetical protein
MTETEAPPYKDRRAGLIFFGLVELLIGIVCLLLVGLSVMGFLLGRTQAGSGAPALQAGQIFPAVAVYLLGGSLLITLGVGSMVTRRWARDLSLVVAWMWLMLGVASTAALVFVMPRIVSLWVAVSAAAMTTMSAYAVLPLGGQIVTGPIAVMTYCAIGILLLYVSWGLFRHGGSASRMACLPPGIAHWSFLNSTTTRSSRRWECP